MMRPRPRLYYNHILMRAKVILLVIVFAIAASGVLGYYYWQTSLAAPSTASEKKAFIIQRGESITSIANRLKAEGFIRDPLAFKLYLKKEGIGGRIEAGDYKLPLNLSVPELVQVLQHGMAERWFTVIEGWRVEEIAEAAKQELGVNQKEFLAIAQEGYMFPDTYLVPVDADAATVSAILRRTFDQKVDEKIRADAQKQGLRLSEVIVLASLVEREALAQQERPIIAGILRRRLELGMSLQVDATLQYALGYQPQEQKTKWWKQNLTSEDKKVDSFYNTYAYPGLPPGPICNPGLASIKAVVYSAKTDYLYYLHDKNGKVYYAKTNEEHEENKRKAGL